MAELTIDSKASDLFLLALSSATQSAAVEIVTTDRKAQDYWGVLERGSAPARAPWPSPKKKTVRGRDGRIFSKQAPQGFIYRYATQFIEYLSAAYQRAFTGAGGPPDQAQLEAAVEQAGNRTLDFIETVVPVDSGNLKNSLRVRKSK